MVQYKRYHEQISRTHRVKSLSTFGKPLLRQQKAYFVEKSLWLQFFL